jgi:2,5-diketo-D-gluconate reductase A
MRRRLADTLLQAIRHQTDTENIMTSDLINTQMRTIGQNVAMPYVGLGTYLMSNDEAKHATLQAIELGYRHIDTAEFYQNEEGIGQSIRNALTAHGLRRTDLFVTTKLWPGNAAWGQTPKTTASTITSLDSSLSQLGLDYVDLYLIHAPFDHQQRLAQWRGLVALREVGKARAIGVSNFSIAHLEEIKAAGLPLPQANQIELHPWSQKTELVRYMLDHDITPIAYSSLVPLATWRVAPGHDSAKTDRMRSESARIDSPFQMMAAKYGVSEAQILLRWAIQKTYPVLPKSTKSDRLKTNIDLFGFAIDDQDMNILDSLNQGDGVAWSSGDPTKSL